MGLMIFMSSGERTDRFAEGDGKSEEPSQITRKVRHAMDRDELPVTQAHDVGD
jgi:hypothetical protein